MKVFEKIVINTVQDDKGEWFVTIDAPAGTKLSVVESRDLCRIVREISFAPDALHRVPAPEPTFCEEDKVL